MLYLVQQTRPNGRSEGNRESQLSEIIISPLIKKIQKERRKEQAKKCVRLSKAFNWTALYFVLCPVQFTVNLDPNLKE
jgi:hypothetical protein